MLIEPGARLELAGHILPGHCGDAHATTALRISLEEARGATLLKLSDSAFGDVSDEVAGQLSEGWKLLMRDGFKRYVEEGVRAEGV